MRHAGSVLVVVLGLLAILAVVGVAFITMSTMDRTTAASFAMQTQMMLTADGAVEYAIHQMVLDVWEWEVTTTGALGTFQFTGRLLTGRPRSGSGPTPPYYWSCEPYDHPSTDDAWLASTIVSNSEPSQLSFYTYREGTETGPEKRFAVRLGKVPAAEGKVWWPDNLGIPVASPLKNGLWAPELAFAFDQYVARASITVQDHNAMINFNAHGNRDTGTWEYGDCRGQGYFISDVEPTLLDAAIDMAAVLGGAGTTPGCWGADKSPRNVAGGSIVPENPGAADFPFTLDEEFELRHLWGTYFTSRLERFWTALGATPSDYPHLTSKYTYRLKSTTVSWTAEVRGYDPTSGHVKASALGSPTWDGHEWSCPKPDLNTASAQAIYEALRDSKAWTDAGELKQTAANIIAFRQKDTAAAHPNAGEVLIGGANYIGAARQPLFTEATCELLSTDASDPADIKRTYAVKVEVYNPWPGDFDGDGVGGVGDGKLKTLSMAVTWDVDSPHQVTPGPTAAFNTAPVSTNTMAPDTCIAITDRQVICHNDKMIKDVLKSVRLHYGNPKYDGKTLNLDIIKGDTTGGSSNVKDLETYGRLYRKVDFTDEVRGSHDNSPIRVFYVSDWITGGSATLGTSVAKDPTLRTTAVPIRFPNCVPAGSSGLPVRAPTGTPFKAFPRVGDLDRVLRFQPGTGTDWWLEPWIVTVSKASKTTEAAVKFDWRKDINNLGTPSAIAAARAANVLSVGGPWVDGLDNDGDVKIDAADKGITDAEQAGPPEFRVAGKINLNTAATETLNALEYGVGAAGIASTVATLRAAGPIRSPVEVLTSDATPNGVEVRDEPFTRISNIAGVRSDTFSIYGTVQIIDPVLKDQYDRLEPAGVIRSRRFWALVDRSPALAFPPTDEARYTRPRILNFQWLD